MYDVVNWRNYILDTFALAIAVFFIFKPLLDRESAVFNGYEAALLSLSWTLVACLLVWCSTFMALTFCLRDLLMIGLLVFVCLGFFVSARQPSAEAINFTAGMTLGKGTKFFLLRWKQWEQNEFFLYGLVFLLAFSSWWHFGIRHGLYHGPRWMGIWNNPNLYGELMSVGLVLAAGLLIQMRVAEYRLRNAVQKSEIGIRNPEARGRKLLPAMLFFAAGMMVMGLVFSYSRGAWLGTAVGLLYLAKAYGKFRWWFVLPSFLIAAAVICFFWNATPDSASWYIKRLDFSRASAQHRVAAWKAGVEIIRDHPFGVGWNKTVDTYLKHYSPPENGAMAITTNDYFMLGTQLGLLALIFFAAYIVMCFKTKYEPGEMRYSARACRAATIAILVDIWFDGGLFDQPTAVMFWVLLELGCVKNGQSGSQPAK